MRPRECHECVEPLSGGSRADGLARDLEPLAQVGRVAGGRDRTGGVEQDGVARAAVLA